MQTVWAGYGDDARMLSLPDPGAHLLPGVRWGCASALFSPAYWVARCAWPDATLPRYETNDGSLVEEVGFCLLGGFGIKYEMNRLAFEKLKSEGVFDTSARFDAEHIRQLLISPFQLGGRAVRYRFPNQRALRIAAMRETLDAAALMAMEPLAMRQALQSIDGVGPKTASWVVRNLLGSDEVAILDVHVVRACHYMGLFPAGLVLPNDYPRLEALFLTFARAAGLRPSVLDALMWAEARASPGFMPLVDSPPRSVNRASETGDGHGRTVEQ